MADACVATGLTPVDKDIARNLEATAAEAVAALRRASVRDWLDELQAGGDALKSDEAAYVMNCSTDTARRRAEAAAGKPIAVLQTAA
jgi:hypothetical protein